MKSFRTAFSVIAIVMLACAMFAQTATSTTSTAPAATTSTASTAIFSASTQAVAIRLGGQTTAATDITESLALFPTVQIAEHNILAPGLNLQGYYGAGQWTPNLTNLISKTLLPANTFQPYVEGGAGVVMNTGAGGKNHFSAFFGGGINYDPTGSGKFLVTPVRIDYFNAPGFGRPSGLVVAAGMTVTFGSH